MKKPSHWFILSRKEIELFRLSSPNGGRCKEPLIQEAFKQFETFVQSFKFLKKTFYENFADQLKQAGL